MKHHAASLIVGETVAQLLPANATNSIPYFSACGCDLHGVAI